MTGGYHKPKFAGMQPTGKEYARWLKQQAERRERIKVMKRNGVSYSEIGRALKISRQRARELALA